MKPILFSRIARCATPLVAFSAVVALASSAQAQFVYTESFDDEAIGATTATETTGGPAGIGGSLSGVTASVGVPSANNSVTTSALVAMDDNTLRDFATSVNVVRAGAGSVTGFAGAAGQFTGVAGNDFTFTSDVQLDSFTLTSGAVNAANFGLSFLAGSASDVLNLGNRYAFILTRFGTSPAAGRVTLTEVTAGVTANHVSSASGVSLLDGTNYTFTISGSYATPGNPGSALTLNASVFDGTDTASISFTDPTPRSGSFFGYRTGMNITAAGNATLDVDYDNFSLTVVPEPASASLLGLAAGALLAPRRRRRA